MKETPSQTAGPYVHIGCAPGAAGLETHGPQLGAQMVTGAPSGERITLDLMIYDGAGDPVRDAMVEIWQANPAGTFTEVNGFRNWGRQVTHLNTGAVRFETLKPGGDAPHILVWIVARGINLGLSTRIYFEGDAMAHDPVFQAAGARASTLVARRSGDGYVHDIYLQGDKETVFFDV